MSRNQVRVIHDASIQLYSDVDRLHLQWCRYDLEDENAYGYRFMWSHDGRLKPLRGGARIPSWEDMHRLMQIAANEGWAYKSEKNI